MATKKAEIALAEGRKDAAISVMKYMEEQMKVPDNSFQSAYDQKRNAIELSHKIRQEKLSAQIESTKVRIESAKTQIEAKKAIIAANAKSSVAVTGSSDQKVIVAQKTLQNAVDKSFASLSRIFYDSNTNNTKNISGASRVLRLSANSNISNSLQISLAQFANLYLVNTETLEALIARAESAESTLQK
jgi:hypothetical protein